MLIRFDRRAEIHEASIVPEFGGIDHLPDSLDALRSFQP